MELLGAVNQYVPYAKGSPPPLPAVYIINLANGTTPFISFFGGVEYRSNFYRMAGAAQITITHAYYRPTREEFDKLEPSTQDHVLNGGLLKAPLKEALAKQLPNDLVHPRIEYEAFQAWCQEVYGRRLKK